MKHLLIIIFVLIGLFLPGIRACDCNTAAAPVCVAGACQPCRNDADCGSISGKPFCSNGVCKACNELTHAGCTLSQPYCNSGTCVSCTSNLHCQMHDKNQGFTQITHVKCNTGICSTTTCSSDTECLLPEYPKCSGGACQATCSVDSDCSRFSDFKKCISGKCRGCITDADCTGGKICSTSNDETKYSCVTCEPGTARGCTTNLQPFCTFVSPTQTTCSGCYHHSDCLNSQNMIYQDRTVCNPNTGQCTSTMYGSACSGTSCTSAGASYCYFWTAYNENRCYTCILDSHCSHVSDKKYCKSDSCVSCTSSAHCTTMAKPRCDLSSYQCANCVSNSDCSNHFPNTVCYSPTPYTPTTYSCVQCAVNSDCQVKYTTGVCNPDNTCAGLLPCSTNSCNDATFSECDSNNYCRRCQSDGECTKFSSTPYCYKPGDSKNYCVRCYLDSHCDSAQGYFCSSQVCSQLPCTTKADCVSEPSVPECDLTGSPQVCVKCTTDAQCKAWYNDITYICTVATGNCSQSPYPCYDIVNWNDCTTVAKAFCNDGVCSACTLDGHCTHIGGKPYCLSGKCVECRDAADCTVESPVCQTPAHVCGGCQDDLDCNTYSTKPHCKSATGKCQECVFDNHCNKLEAPVCRESDGTCQPCTTNDECKKWWFIWACDPTPTPNRCVQCLVDSDCDPTYTTKVCASQQCTFSPPCSEDEDCNNEFPKCMAPTPGNCRRCENDTDCEGRGAFSRCKVDAIAGLNECVQCLSNADCSVFNGETCNLSTNRCDAPQCNQWVNNNTECASITLKPNCNRINCRGCQDDEDCKNWYWGQGLKCDTTSRRCYHPNPTCTSWEGCNYPNMANCVHFLPLDELHCWGCNSTTQCTERFPTTPYCNTTGGICVECLSNTNCTDPTKSVCQASVSCVPCTNHTGCSHIPGKKYCDGAGECRECTANTGCTVASKSRCDLSTYTCQACIGDGDCSHLASTRFCYNSVCVQCLSNNDCTDPKKSRCVGNTCVACDSHSDCNQIPAYPYCQPITSTKACSQCRGDTDCPFLYTGGSCTAQSGQMLCTDNSPACTTDANCASNTKYPICDTTMAQPKCRRCTIDTECASGKPYCYPTTGASVCVQCRTGADCPSGQVCVSHTCQAFTCNNATQCVAKDPTLPECGNGKCVTCPSDAQCQAWHTRSYGCNSETGACFDGATNCTTDSDCTNSFLAKCGSTNKCVPCESDANCAHISGGKHVCRIDLAKYCLQCMVNIQCTDSAFPVCDTNGLCKQCSSNLDCSALFASLGKPLCSSSSHGCVECTADSFCSDPTKPYCRTTLDEKCVQCLQPSHCPNSVFAKCDSSGTCSACTDHSDCTDYHGPKGLPYCSLTLGCVECVENDNCLTKSPKKVCKTDPGVCVECISNSDCTDAAKSVCANNVCVVCQGNSDCSLFFASGLSRCSLTLGCVKCIGDSDCTTSGLTHCKLNPGICVECTDNSQCTSPTLPVCTSSNTCTTCSIVNDCLHFVSLGFPYCSPATHGCVECLLNDHCTGTAYYCESSSQTCQGCLESAHCTDPAKTVCDTTSHQCIECTIDNDCPATHPNCYPGHGCVSCVDEPSACASNQACDAATGRCEPCDTSCLTCSLPNNSSACLTCPPNTYYTAIFGTCTSPSCPPLYIPDNTLMICIKHCPPNCFDCVNSTFCNLCKPGFYAKDSFNCTADCGYGFFGYDNNRTCGSCHPSCGDCDITATNCTACKPPYVFDSWTCTASGGPTVTLSAKNQKAFLLKFSEEMDLTESELQQNITITFSISNSSDYQLVSIKLQPGKLVYEITMNYTATMPKQKVRVTFANFYLIKDKSGAHITQEFVETDSLRYDLLSPAAQETLDNMVSMGKMASGTTMAMAAGLFFTSSTPAIFMDFLSVIQLLNYLLFINVNYPENVMNFFQIFNMGSFAFLPDPIALLFPNLAEAMEEPLPAPPKFLDNDMDGRFLNNTGESLGMWVLMIFFYFVVKIVLQVCRLSGRLLDILNTIKGKFEWELFYGNIIGNYMPIFLAVVLQANNMNFEDSLNSSSCILMLLVGGVCLVFPFVAMAIIGRNADSLERPFFAQRHGALYEQFKVEPDDTVSGETVYYRRNFIAFQLFRKIMYVSALVLAYNIPLLQIGILTLTGVKMVVLYGLIKPFREKSMAWLNVGSEIIMLLIHIVIYVFVGDDQTQKFGDELRIKLGWLIVALCSLLVVYNAAIVFFMQVLQIRDFCRKIRKKEQKSKKYQPKTRNARDLMKFDQLPRGESQSEISAVPNQIIPQQQNPVPDMHSLDLDVSGAVQNSEMGYSDVASSSLRKANRLKLKDNTKIKIVRQNFLGL